MASKSAPLSIRLSPALHEHVEREARMAKRSKGSIVEELAEEALRMRRFPGIGFRELPPYRRAWVVGTPLDVWEVVKLARGLGPSELSEHFNVSAAQLRVALAYYEDHPDEIDDRIAANERPLEELQRLYPEIDTIVIDD
ncbi:MAG TPA: hypothetical protein VNT32_12355 [Thermoleophilaceae bacterium]|nr:hypothetical protein [Thermoleophilaceae bacterium]